MFFSTLKNLIHSTAAYPYLITYPIQGGSHLHSNRILYSLPEYQRKLERNAASFTLLLRDDEEQKDFFLKPKPKSLWHPEYQGAYLAPRIVQLRQALLTYKYDFLTLTYWTKYMSAEEVAKRHKTDINKFFKLLRKIYGRLQYAYVVEVTEQNYVHFHIFIEKRISEKICRRIWRGLTGAWRIKKKKIDNSAIAIQYVNKYVNKVADGEESKLTFMYDNIDRFFGCSRDFFKDVKKDDKKHIYRLLAHLYAHGDFTALLKSKKLEGKILTSSQVTDIMSGERKGFRFVYDEDGGLYAEMIQFRESNDMIDFYLDFVNKRDRSFSNALNSDNKLYVTYAE